MWLNVIQALFMCGMNFVKPCCPLACLLTSFLGKKHKLSNPAGRVNYTVPKIDCYKENTTFFFSFHCKARNLSALGGKHMSPFMIFRMREWKYKHDYSAQPSNQSYMFVLHITTKGKKILRMQILSSGIWGLIFFLLYPTECDDVGDSLTFHSLVPSKHCVSHFSYFWHEKYSCVFSLWETRRAATETAAYLKQQQRNILLNQGGDVSFFFCWSNHEASLCWAWQHMTFLCEMLKTLDIISLSGPFGVTWKFWTVPLEW